jgi:hypothetical protein
MNVSECLEQKRNPLIQILCLFRKLVQRSAIETKAVDRVSLKLKKFKIKVIVREDLPCGGADGWFDGGFGGAGDTGGAGGWLAVGCDST